MGHDPTERTAPGGDPGSTISARPIDRPEAVIALFCAAAGGALVFVVTVVLAENASPGGSYWKGGLALSVVAAGIGWCVGFAVGLVLTTWMPPTGAESWVLRGIAAVFLLAGFTHWWVTQDIVPPFSHELRFAALERAIRLDAGLASVTCAALAQRRGHRLALAVGLLLALAIAVVSVVLYATGPCPLSPCPGPKLSS